MRRLAVISLLASSLSTAAIAEDQPMRFFMSGHSLIDRPIPDMLASIVEHAGQPVEWERQHLDGSTIRQRTLGEDSERPGSGYSAGFDRNGAPINVLEVIGKEPGFDIFIVTERHKVLETLVEQGTIRHLREFDRQVTRANPDAKTYFYASWADMSDLGEPQDWIAYERLASPVWHCIAERASAAKDGKHKIGFIPASRALAELIAQLIESENMPGFTGMEPGEITAQIFSDKVHLTDLGSYYIALITYGAIFDADLSQAWLLSTLDPEQAKTLRRVAAEFSTQWQAVGSRETKPDCTTLEASFISAYTSYMQAAYANPETGWFKASLKGFRERTSLMWQFHGWGRNPLIEESAD